MFNFLKGGFGGYTPAHKRKMVMRTFYDFNDFVEDPPSRQVRRQIARRKYRMPVHVDVRAKGRVGGTRKMRVA